MKISTSALHSLLLLTSSLHLVVAQFYDQRILPQGKTLSRQDLSRSAFQGALFFEDDDDNGDDDNQEEAEEAEEEQYYVPLISRAKASIASAITQNHQTNPASPQQDFMKPNPNIYKPLPLQQGHMDNLVPNTDGLHRPGQDFHGGSHQSFGTGVALSQTQKAKSDGSKLDPVPPRQQSAMGQTIAKNSRLLNPDIAKKLDEEYKKAQEQRNKYPLLYSQKKIPKEGIRVDGQAVIPWYKKFGYAITHPKEAFNNGSLSLQKARLEQQKKEETPARIAFEKNRAEFSKLQLDRNKAYYDWISGKNAENTYRLRAVDAATKVKGLLPKLLQRDILVDKDPYFEQDWTENDSDDPEFDYGCLMFYWVNESVVVLQSYVEWFEIDETHFLLVQSSIVIMFFNSEM